jgi:hypothetical protein
MVIILLSACFLADVSIFLKGKEISREWWQSRYENSLLGVGFWIVAFPLVSGKILYFINQKMGGNNNWLYWIGGLLSLLCYCFLGFLISFFSQENIPVCGFVIDVMQGLISQ